MKINGGREAGTSSERRTQTFTGEVWTEALLQGVAGLLVNDVFFRPGARTDWHTHGGGQILFVKSGLGYAKVRGGEGAWIRTGDVVFFEPGEEHFHGAGPDSVMLHTAVSLGEMDWLEAVADEDYEAETGAR